MGYEVVMKEVAPEPLASVRGIHRVADLARIMGREFGRIIRAAVVRGLQPSSEMPGGNVAFMVYVGPYDQIHVAYRAIQDHARANGLAPADMMLRRYLTDPAVEPDPTKRVAEV